VTEQKAVISHHCPRRWEPVRAGIPAVALFLAGVTNSASKNFDCFRPDKRGGNIAIIFLDFLLTV
jgi:hypothetical protein